MNDCCSSDHGGGVTWGLVAVKRRWVPHWLFGWFCPDAATRQPWRWALTRPVDPFTARRINGESSAGLVVKGGLQ